MPVVTALCADPDHARAVVAALRDAGLRLGAPAAVVRDPALVRHAVPAALKDIFAGATAGTGVGGTLGGAAGWLVDATEAALGAASAAALEVVDPELAAGAAVGAVSGALLGTHAAGSAAIYAAEDYAREVARGAALLRLEIRDRATTRRAIRVLRAHGAQRIRAGELA
jgi:hypothetical protein